MDRICQNIFRGGLAHQGPGHSINIAVWKVMNVVINYNTIL